MNATVVKNPTIDWENPTFKLGVAVGKLLAGDKNGDMDRYDFCYNINEFIVDEAEIELNLELLSKCWDYYTSDGAEIVDDKYVSVGDGMFGFWTINEEGRCVEYDEEEEEDEEEYPVDMTDDDKHIVSISAEEQEENDKTANQYDEEEKTTNVATLEDATHIRRMFCLYHPELQHLKEQTIKEIEKEKKPKKKPLMIAEPDDDDLFRSLCMDANEANGYGRTC